MSDSPTNPTLDAALQYIAHGWSIIPLVPGTKRPAVAVAPYLAGTRRMTADDAKLDWYVTPQRGVGIVTGTPSNIAVIDIDPRNGGSLAAVQQAGIGPTLTATTGGGGLHLYCFSDDPDLRCGRTIIPGVDLKANGGFVVAPPSGHPSGGVYGWTGDVVDLASLPEWARHRPETPMGLGVEDRQHWIADTLAAPEDVLPGTQEDTLTRLAWWAAGALPPDIARVTLLQWARRLPLGNAHDPWTEEQVADRLDRAVKRRAEVGAFRVRLDGGGGEVGRQDVEAEARPALATLVRTAPEVLATEHAEVDWLVEGLLAPGCWTEIVGAQKEGKSTFLYAMVKAMLHGASFVDLATTQTHALVVTEQVGKSLIATLKRAGLEGEPGLNILTIGDTFGRHWPTMASEIIDLAVERHCKLVVFDTFWRLAATAAIDENDSRAVQLFEPLQKAKAAGLAVAFLRHGRKSGGAVNQAARGSSALTGEMDIVVGVTCPHGLATPYRKIDTVSRLSDMDEMHLAYKAGAFTKLDKAPSHASVADTQDGLLAFITSKSPKPAEWSDILSFGEHQKWGKTTIARRLRDLRASGRVRHVQGEGYYANPEAVMLADLEAE
jgi:hypothetical protein